MHEYEFRLVVQHDTSFVPLLQSFGYPLKEECVYYVKPHFRFRNGRLETKHIESVHAVYSNRLWFRWVHSRELSYGSFTRSTCSTFVHHTGNFQDSFRAEKRTVLKIDSQAQLYCFQKGFGCYRLIFEWEYGTFSKPLAHFESEMLLGALDRYQCFYESMRPFTPPPTHTLKEGGMLRRTVTIVDAMLPCHLYALKWDGTFGLVLSFRDRIKEKWEGYECVVRPGVTLGDGFIFAAERLADGQVCLLDVYQVRGSETAPWCRRQILTEFLPQLPLIQGYFTQTYVADASALPSSFPFSVDGIIIHDTVKDLIFKYKTTHSIDLVYYDGHFQLPFGRIKCSVEGLEEGCVYEISTRDGSVLRRRWDRFKGNSALQLEEVLKNGWHGPPIEPLPIPVPKKKQKQKQKQS